MVKQRPRPDLPVAAAPPPGLLDLVFGQLGDDVVTVLDDGLCIRWQSPATRRVFGFDPAEVVGKHLLHDVHPEDRELVQLCFAEALEQNRPEDAMLTVSCRLCDAAGSWRDVETTVSDRRDDPAVAGIVLHTRDVTDRMTLQRQIARMAFTDVLTGLGNRAALFERLERALAVGAPLTVLALNIDGFRKVNDLYGHDVGDGLLVEAGNRLSAWLRSGDVVARTSADEFLVLLDGHVEQAVHVADRMLTALAVPYDFPEGRVEVTASIGITYTRDQPDTAEVLREADLALRRARASGRGRTEQYQIELHTDVLRRLTLERDLRAAVEAQQLELVYQPLVAFADGRVASVETLLRWRHATRGDVPPEEFVAVAEECGLIGAVGRWVLDQACAQAAAWQAEGHDLKVAVNVSVRQVQSRRLVEDVRAALDRSGLPARRLVLEITESVLLGETDRTVADLEILHDMGCGIALDDFGKGYSSLSYLRRLPADVLKIDREFVAGVPDDAELTALTESTVLLGTRLGLQVVCEGVETLEQFSALAAIGATYAQGFGLAGPMSVDQVSELLRSGRPVPAPPPARGERAVPNNGSAVPLRLTASTTSGTV